MGRVAGASEDAENRDAGGHGLSVTGRAGILVAVT
jgi:hypothetical protein